MGMKYWLFSGGYGPREENIRRWLWDGHRIQDHGPAAFADNASFLLVHPRLPLLYAAQELEAGLVRVYWIDPSGNLSLIQEMAAGVHHPCHLAIGPAQIQAGEGGEFLAVSGYWGGFAFFELDSEGLLQGAARTFFPEFDPDSAGMPERQDASHPHGTVFDGQGNWYACDLGTDRVYFGTEAGIVAGSVHLEPGSGPRHAVTGHEKVYVVNELSCSLSLLGPTGPGADLAILGEWTALDRGSNGELLAADSVPSAPKEYTAAAIFLHGQRLFVTLRGPNLLAEFKLDKHGMPRKLDIHELLSDQPRFAMPLDEKHILVAYQAGNRMEVLAVDGAKPKLIASAASPRLTSLAYSPITG